MAVVEGRRRLRVRTCASSATNAARESLVLSSVDGGLGEVEVFGFGVGVNHGNLLLAFPLALLAAAAVRANRGVIGWDRRVPLIVLVALALAWPAVRRADAVVAVGANCRARFGGAGARRLGRRARGGD
jgi:hypothetical protein